MRQPVPDLLKGVAVIAMIQVHVMEQFARPEIFNGPPGNVSLFLGGPFAAPIFMAVMGYFLGKERPGGREVEKNRIWMKFRRGGALILLGLLLNIGLNFTLLVNIFRGKFEADPFQYIFGADILPLAGLSILIIGLMEVLLKKRGIAALILAVAIPIITPFITGLPEHYKYVQAFIGSPEKWSYFPLFPWLAYPLIGYGWRRSEAEWPSVYDFIVKNLKIVLFISVALVLALAMPAFRNITELGVYYHHGILLFCWMVGFIIAWSYLARMIILIAEHAKIIQYIKWLGEHVTIVYIIQWLIIGNLAYYFHSSQFLVQLVIWFIMILSITSFITYLYVKWKSSWYSE